VKKYSEVKIGMVHFVEFGKFSKFGDKKEVFLNGSNDRKEHNYHWWITSKIHFDDNYWSYGLRRGPKPRYCSNRVISTTGIRSVAR
jgi:pectate lyase